MSFIVPSYCYVNVSLEINWFIAHMTAEGSGANVTQLHSQLRPIQDVILSAVKSDEMN